MDTCFGSSLNKILSLSLFVLILSDLETTLQAKLELAIFLAGMDINLNLSSHFANESKLFPSTLRRLRIPQPRDTRAKVRRS